MIENKFVQLKDPSPYNIYNITQLSSYYDLKQSNFIFAEDNEQCIPIFQRRLSRRVLLNFEYFNKSRIFVQLTK